MPDDQISLSPKSPVIGGRLNYDAYNNGGEWLNSVHDVGPNLVSVNWEFENYHRWDSFTVRITTGSKAGPLEEGRPTNRCHLVGRKQFY